MLVAKVRTYALWNFFTVVAGCSLLQLTATGQTTTTIFSGDRIGFGEGQSREIQKIITFPEFAPTDHVKLDWDVLADADPWDRAGSVHVILPDGDQAQLGKFVTGFNGTTFHSQDISDLAPLLSGQTLVVEAFIDTWVADAWNFNATVTSTPGSTTNSNWAAPVISRDAGFGRGGLAGTTTKQYEIEVPRLQEATLTYFASGHHDNQTSNSDEFNQRVHRIAVDGVEVWSGIPWRSDGPRFRSVNPTSARWDGNNDGDTTDPYPIDYWSSDFPRSGWVPGDEVIPYKLDMTPYFAAGGTHTVSLTIDDIDVDSFWRVSAYLSGTLDNTIPGDLNSDGDVNVLDWTIFVANNETDLSGLTVVERIRRGDLDGDGDSDLSDFRHFKQQFIAFNGAAAWDSLAAHTVPEPNALTALLTALVGLLATRICGRHYAFAYSNRT